jgi:hypothetical protein
VADLGRLPADLFRGKYELVVVDVLENRRGAPRFDFGILLKLHAASFKLLGGGDDVIAPEGHGLEIADAVLVALGVKSVTPVSAPGISSSIQRCSPSKGWSVATLKPSFSV